MGGSLVGSGTGVDVAVGRGVELARWRVAVNVGEGVDVEVGAGVSVEVGVNVGSGVKVGVGVSVGVRLGVGVMDGVSVGVSVGTSTRTGRSKARDSTVATANAGRRPCHAQRSQGMPTAVNTSTSTTTPTSSAGRRQSFLRGSPHPGQTARLRLPIMPQYRQRTCRAFR
jgi:hypothetical protein